VSALNVAIVKVDPEREELTPTPSILVIDQLKVSSLAPTRTVMCTIASAKLNTVPVESAARVIESEERNAVMPELPPLPPPPPEPTLLSMTVFSSALDLGSFKAVRYLKRFP
jgi:hypothetical protein